MGVFWSQLFGFYGGVSMCMNINRSHILKIYIKNHYHVSVSLQIHTTLRFIAACLWQCKKVQRVSMLLQKTVCTMNGWRPAEKTARAHLCETLLLLLSAVQILRQPSPQCLDAEPGSFYFSERSDRDGPASRCKLSRFLCDGHDV